MFSLFYPIFLLVMGIFAAVNIVRVSKFEKIIKSLGLIFKPAPLGISYEISGKYKNKEIFVITSTPYLKAISQDIYLDDVTIYVEGIHIRTILKFSKQFGKDSKELEAELDKILQEAEVLKADSSKEKRTLQQELPEINRKLKGHNTATYVIAAVIAVILLSGSF